MAGQDSQSRPAPIRCQQLPVRHSNCHMSSSSRHSTFVVASSLGLWLYFAPDLLGKPDRESSPTTLTVRVPRPNSASRRRRIFVVVWRDLTGWRSSSAIMYLCRWRTAAECFLDHLYRRPRDLFGDIGRAICAGEFGNFVQSLGALHEVCEGSVQTGTRIH